MENGVYGNLESTIPAITVPAWMSMLTSRNPGTLGFYGFRNRKNYSYDDLVFANSTAVKVDTVWKILARHRRKVILLSVPQTYPPTPVNGCLVGCFLTPNTEVEFTYPPELREEIWRNVGEYIIDVKDFRTEDKQYLLDQIYKMTARRFQTAEYLMTNKPWDFFMLVEMGTDRLHHGMWKFFDEKHCRYQADTPYKNAVRDYYIYLDGKIRELLELVDLKRTAVIVVSDHGTKRMEGGFCFNDWLIQQGYLCLKEAIDKPRQLKNADIDFNRTRVWGSGGYYGRLFLNVEGREPQGVIPAGEYEAFRSEIKQRLEAVVDHKGRPMNNRAFKPEEIYPEVKGVAPDLIVYFGDLDWRSVGTVGNETLYVFENDTGPDDANHAQQGMYILTSPEMNKKGAKLDRKIMDIAPTILNLMGIEIPEEMEGRAIPV
jgi:predicted AlkP superfamily phosphohydrolase/phosphomutase